MTSKLIKTPKFVLLVIAFLGPIALNVYAPIMPTLKIELSSSADAIQLGMTLFLVFFALAQLACGLFVDLFGKRNVLLWGVSLYIIGCVIGILVNDIYWLLLARVLQATGGGLSLLLTRSIILEQNTPNKAAEKLSYVSLGIATLQAIVPTLSGYMNVYYSWRIVFYLSLGIALLAWWASYRFLPDKSSIKNSLLTSSTIDDSLDKKATPEPAPLSLKKIIKTYIDVLKVPHFFYLTLANALVSAGFFTFILNVPFFVEEKLSGSSLDYGKWYIVIALGFWIGSFISSQISERFGSSTMLTLGWSISVFAACCMIICMMAFEVHYWILFVPMALYTFGRGISLPNAQASAVTSTPFNRATAMGVFSFCQLLLGAGLAQISVVFVKQNIIFLPVTIFLLTIFALFSFYKAKAE